MSVNDVVKKSVESNGILVVPVAAAIILLDLPLTDPTERGELGDESSERNQKYEMRIELEMKLELNFDRQND